jgi:hypothetical protein
LFVQQLIARGSWLFGKQRLYHVEGAVRASHDAGYKQYAACGQCSLRHICDGFHGDYAQLFGEDEAAPVTSLGTVRDPLHYIRDQDKVVEAEDRAWAV